MLGKERERSLKRKRGKGENVTFGQAWVGLSGGGNARTSCAGRKGVIAMGPADGFSSGQGTTHMILSSLSDRERDKMPGLCQDGNTHTRILPIYSTYLSTAHAHMSLFLMAACARKTGWVEGLGWEFPLTNTHTDDDLRTSNVSL